MSQGFVNIANGYIVSPLSELFYFEPDKIAKAKISIWKTCNLGFAVKRDFLFVPSTRPFVRFSDDKSKNTIIYQRGIKLTEERKYDSEVNKLMYACYKI